MSPLLRYTDSLQLLTLGCSRSRLHFASYLRKAAFGSDRNFYHHSCLFCVSTPSTCNSRRVRRHVRSTVDGGTSESPESSTNSGTRLLRALQNFQIRLSFRIKELRKGLLMKIFFFLVGFYCATAFATVIGQTGDWDILSAGLAVAVVEGIGALMYKASFQLFDKLKGLITVFNYWKAGLSLGLFLDAFKYEIDLIYESFNPFNTDLDAFQIFW